MFRAGDLLYAHRLDAAIYTLRLGLRATRSNFLVLVTYVTRHPWNPNYSYVLYCGELVAIYDSDFVVIK